ncbi:MAG: hypothetical protein ACK55Z_24540, partial [bacterium]
HGGEGGVCIQYYVNQAQTSETPDQMSTWVFILQSYCRGLSALFVKFLILLVDVFMLSINLFFLKFTKL